RAPPIVAARPYEVQDHGQPRATSPSATGPGPSRQRSVRNRPRPPEGLAPSRPAHVSVTCGAAQERHGCDDQARRPGRSGEAARHERRRLLLAAVRRLTGLTLLGPVLTRTTALREREDLEARQADEAAAVPTSPVLLSSQAIERRLDQTHLAA